MDKFKGITYDEFHKFRIARYPSLANEHNSNFNKMMKWKDDIDYGLMLEIDEQGKAKDINYAHDLELDDIGYDLHIERNGLDDEMYRFYLLLHRITVNSKGTFNDISVLIASLLGCSPNDIQLSNDRHYDQNGNLVGKLNTINIQSIDFDKVKNPDFIPLLPNTVEKATLASTKITEIGFYASANMQMYSSIAYSIRKSVSAFTNEYIQTESYTGYAAIAYGIRHNISVETKGE